ncbi:hypothetical protein KKC08_03710 [Patescibacteria group bacterium]|nr:hypothetical protein [Patescibacteria group bacterium]MCG2702033.1 hypothetical protein [Candidatus Parcubacteria bacterium]MBU4265552.1 hypothetical protein [Patescibacteria group bacterium]MBU4389881.1 hypothetical protein [Patescibacteria group bacterium]MBU4397246.1 hypothetical protein [Patescibacteria group bacterium]
MTGVYDKLTKPMKPDFYPVEQQPKAATVRQIAGAHLKQVPADVTDSLFAGARAQVGKVMQKVGQGLGDRIAVAGVNLVAGLVVRGVESYNTERKQKRNASEPDAKTTAVVPFGR